MLYDAPLVTCHTLARRTADMHTKRDMYKRTFKRSLSTKMFIFLL